MTAASRPDLDADYPAIVIQDGRWFECFVFVPFPGGDLHGALFQDPGSSWEFRYRFRYYDAGPGPDAPDTKNWYRVLGKPEGSYGCIHQAAEHVVAHVIGLASEIVGIAFDPSTMIVPVRSSDAITVSRVLSRQDFAHVIPTAKGGQA